MSVMVTPFQRSTKAGDYPRLRPAVGWGSVTPRCIAQRRPEITPGYDPGAGRITRPSCWRSTKAGDYPRLRPLDEVAAAFGWSCAQRRPEITPGYDRRLPAPRGGTAGALNEGRRLPPATTPSPGGLGLARTIAQRRPEITPGYDLKRRSRLAMWSVRSTKAGDYPRLRRRRAGHHPGRSGRSTKAGDYPRLRLEFQVCGSHLVIRRSTKAGDYPRLRPPTVLHPLASAHSAQRRPEITPGYDGSIADTSPSISRAQRRPEITPGYDANSNGASTGETRTLNEGRRLPPATTRAAPGYAAGVEPRSTKAGDYPRLRRAGRVRHSVERRNAQRRPGGGPAQRRPEITPGYDGSILHEIPSIACAQRRPEITPGYDLVRLVVLIALCTRSTKAGDYPRLRPPYRGPRRPRNGPRSTKAGDYPRLRPIVRAERVSVVCYAQRRPEITPGYDPDRRDGDRPMTGRPAQRRPEITPGYDVIPLYGSLDGPPVAQRRPEITPGYDQVRQARNDRRWRAQRRPEITPGYDTPARTPTTTPSRCAQRRPEITPGYDVSGGRVFIAAMDDAQRRPEITPGYDNRSSERR